MASTKKEGKLMSRGNWSRFIDVQKRRLASVYALLMSLGISLWSAAPALAQESATTPERPRDLINFDSLAPWQQVLVEFFKVTLFVTELWRITLAAGALAFGFVLRSHILDRIFRPLQALTKRSKSRVDDALLQTLRRPLTWVIRLVAFYVALVILEPADSLMRVATLGLQTVGTIMVAWVIFHLADIFAMALTRSNDEGGAASLDRQLVPLVMNVVRAVLFVFVAIALIQQWGYDVTSLVAGLGIGGLAFALAAKPTLSNWFGSLMIFTDRPFKIGDWVNTRHGEGVIEGIGVCTIKIVTLA